QHSPVLVTPEIKAEEWGVRSRRAVQGTVHPADGSIQVGHGSASHMGHGEELCYQRSAKFTTSGWKCVAEQMQLGWKSLNDCRSWPTLSQTYQGSLMKRVPLRLLSIAAWLTLLVPPPASAQEQRFRWTVSQPLVAPAPRPGDRCFGIKDPSIV